MLTNAGFGDVISSANVQEFFQDSVSSAMANQQVEAEANTTYYLVTLLTNFVRTENLFTETPDGRTIKPLAILFCEALESSSSQERKTALKQLGDISLFVSGYFSNSLRRKLVDVDYYIGMGCNAYGSLSDILRSSAVGRASSDVYEELANKFHLFVDVLGEISDQSQTASDKDILRLYDLWMQTGSKRAEKLLQGLGMQPSDASISRSQH